MENVMPEPDEVPEIPEMSEEFSGKVKTKIIGEITSPK
jgi:hypothetical protein